MLPPRESLIRHGTGTTRPVQCQPRVAVSSSPRTRVELARILVSGSDAYEELGTNPRSAGALVTAAPAPAQEEEAWPKNLGRARPEGWAGVGMLAFFPSLMPAVCFP